MGFSSGASQTTLDAVKAKTDTLPPSGRRVFASDIAASVAVTAVAGDKTLPSVIIPVGAIPTGVTISRVLAGVAWRKQVDSSAAQNSVNGAQVVQVRSDAPGTWRNSIDLANGTLLTAASGTEGGQLIIGDNDIKAEVTGADTYEFKWTSATVTAASLTFYDVQTFLIVEYQ